MIRTMLIVLVAPPYRTKLQDGDLFSFLEKYLGGHAPLAIKIPKDDNESPSIEISREMCQDLIMHVMESERQRIGLQAANHVP